MPYTINHYNGDQVAVVADGTIDSTLDIKLIGKNYAGYGELQNENLVYLLENFANTNAPPKPTKGQMWYDTSNKKLKYYSATGATGWKTTGGAEVSTIEPTGLSVGDFWWDSDNKQLYSFNGTDYTLVGPQAAGTQQTEMISRLVIDTLGGSHPIICAVVNGVTTFIISSDPSTYTLKDSVNAIAGFTDIHPGITLVNTNDPANPGQTTAPTKFYGTSTNSDLLGGYPASAFVQANSATFNTQVEFGDTGYTVGLANKKLFVTINPSGNPVFQSKSNTMIFQTTIASVTKTPLTLVGNDILPDTSGNSNIGSSSFRYATVYANQFDGIASQADSLTVGGLPRTGSTAQTAPNTIAVRDASSYLWAVEFKGVASSANYADLAEKYLADKEYEVGTVLMVGGDKEVTACQVGFRAVGPVSEKPAYMMNSELEGGTYVALKGRVPVKVTGNVIKGQRLVAGADGTAQAAMGNTADVFAVALETNSDAGVRLVECLIL